MSDIFQSVVDTITTGMLNACKLVFNILPNSPFKVIDNSVINEYIPGLNWIFPISQMVAILEAWVSCILTYYAYQIILRWSKAIK